MESAHFRAFPRQKESKKIGPEVSLVIGPGMKGLMRSYCTVQEVKFFIKDFFSKCDEMRSFLRIWSHILKKTLMKNSCAMLAHIDKLTHRQIDTGELSTKK